MDPGEKEVNKKRWFAHFSLIKQFSIIKAVLLDSNYHTMAEDNDLEKRAIEELLRETDRARVRAETMGPAGWLKCPLKSTNKRFLLNTLRSTGLQRRSDESKSESVTRGRLLSESPDRRRDRSRSPHRDRERHRGHRDKYYHEESSSRKHKGHGKEEERRDRHTRERKHERGNEGHKKDRRK